MDLIVLLDASGSLREVGFAILCTFTATLTPWFQARFRRRCHEAALLVFGNGRLDSPPDGTFTVEEPWCPKSDFWHRLVTTMISSVKWLRGFTYMAQGFTTAGKVVSQGGRQTPWAGSRPLWRKIFVQVPNSRDSCGSVRALRPLC